MKIETKILQIEDQAFKEMEETLLESLSSVY